MTSMTSKTSKITFLLVPAILTSTAALIMGATSISTVQSSNQPATQKPTTLQIGQPAPDFTLPDLKGTNHTLSDYTKAGNIVVLEWFNPNCPFVRKHYRSGDLSILNTLNAVDSKNIVWLRINSALGTHPTAKLEFNAQSAIEFNIKGPILLDPVGTTGKAYHATKTPQVFIINADGNLAYQGAPDNRSDAAAPGNISHILNALKELVAQEPVTTTQTTPYGCKIKYD